MDAPIGAFRTELQQALTALTAPAVLPGSYSGDDSAETVAKNRDAWVASHGNAIKQLLEAALAE